MRGRAGKGRRTGIEIEVDAEEDECAHERAEDDA
jgi:hypothetical protein